MESTGSPTAGTTSPGTSVPTLSDRDRGILDFERDWTRSAAAKDEAVLAQFGLSLARYYQLLNAVIDSPAAIAHDPLLVRRLQRVRDTRASARIMVPATGSRSSTQS